MSLLPSAFTDWLRENGYQQTLLDLSEFPETGRGMRATRDIAAGELLVSIPVHLLLTGSTPDVVEVGERICPGARLWEHQLLALFLACNRHPTSKWAPYISVLPDAFDTIASMMPLAVKDAMPRTMREMAGRIEGKMIRDWEGVRAGCERDGSVTFETYRWAWFAVNTRCISLNPFPSSPPSSPSSSQRTQLPAGSVPPPPTKIALAPLLDLLNHSSSSTVQAGLHAPSSTYRIRTLDGCAKCQQAFINYGCHGNVALLCEYGFVDAGNLNPCDSITVTSDAMDVLVVEGEDARSKEVARSVLRGCGLDGDFVMDRTHDPARLLAALRVRVMCTGSSVPQDVTSRCWCEMEDATMEARVKDAVTRLCEGMILEAREGMGKLDAIGGQAAGMVRTVWEGMIDILQGTLTEMNYVE
ncbi:SET domain-containing protein 4 [Thoreauomyces humboldtii]|nr:SET domain-containing protein 4 [Thoreauomyces humboldtii]